MWWGRRYCCFCHGHSRQPLSFVLEIKVFTLIGCKHQEIFVEAAGASFPRNGTGVRLGFGGRTLRGELLNQSKYLITIGLVTTTSDLAGPSMTARALAAQHGNNNNNNTIFKEVLKCFHCKEKSGLVQAVIVAQWKER